MTTPAKPLEVAVADLRAGLYIELDLSWTRHPFASSHFLIKTDAQLATLRTLGLAHVRVLPERSDPKALAALQGGHPAEADLPAAPEPAVPASMATPATSTTALQGTAPKPLADAAQHRHRELLAAQSASLAHSQKMHGKAVQGWLAVMQEAVKDPAAAAENAQTLSGHLVEELTGSDDTTIRVLGEAAGTGSVQHAINVTVMSLMLARRMALPDLDLKDVALGALVHDIGKLALPEALRHASGDSALAARAQREHVALGLRLGMSMGLAPDAMRIIAQHHELVDGSGLPQGLSGEQMSPGARIVAVADRYDRLCNPAEGGTGRTPHEAQALLYAQLRHQLDPQVLTTFIKLVGVYPPGSVVQLSDGRYALVVSTHPQQPLKPTVLVHDAGVPRDEALLLDLMRAPKLGIRRSLHPQHLPRTTLDYLSPGDRVHYYFAHEMAAAPLEAQA
jgi:putative nucleotidyltransferase with HDIG domain